jgi:hypothetical protein
LTRGASWTYDRSRQGFPALPSQGAGLLADPQRQVARLSFCYLAGMEDVADRIVRRIEENILDRRGLKWELRQCDDEIREQIREAWRMIIREEMKAGW